MAAPRDLLSDEHATAKIKHGAVDMTFQQNTAPPGQRRTTRRHQMTHHDSLLLEQSMAVKPQVLDWQCNDILAWVATLALPLDPTQVGTCSV